MLCIEEGIERIAAAGGSTEIIKGTTGFQREQSREIISSNEWLQVDKDSWRCEGRWLNDLERGWWFHENDRVQLQPVLEYDFQDI